MVIAKSLFYFVLAGLCEIGGGYLVWLWLRENKSPWLALVGAIVLIFYGIMPNIPTSTLWQSLCCIWRDLHCYVHAVGLAGRQDTTRQVRFYRGFHRAYRCLYHHVLAKKLISTTFSHNHRHEYRTKIIPDFSPKSQKIAISKPYLLT